MPTYGLLLDQTWRVLTKIVGRYLYGPVLGPLFHELVNDPQLHLQWPDPAAVLA